MLRRLLALPLVSALSAVLLVAGCSDSKQPNPAASAPPPAVTVVKVTAAEIKPATTFTGRIEAQNKVDLRVRVDGVLEKRLFVEGADVKEDELLFVIEKGFYEAAVDQAKAAVMTAEATLKLADIDVDRQTQLLQRNVTAQATLDQSIAKQGEARGNMLAQKVGFDRGHLLQAGVEIYEYEPQILHAKMIGIGPVTYIGSANLDIRSLRLNYELILRFNDKAISIGANRAESY